MIRSVKFRIYPNEEQKEIIEKTLGVCRFVYNYGLNMIDKAYYEHHIRIRYADVSAAITKLKELDGYKWINEVSRDAITNTLKDLNNAYNLFFNGKRKYPKPKDGYKRKKKTFRVLINITQDKIDKKYVNIAKLGYVKSQKGLYIPDNYINRISITKTSSGKYYVGIKYKEDDIPELDIDSIEEYRKVGIDVGVHTYATLSTGEKIEYPGFYEKELKRLNHYSKEYWRKPSLTSKNHIKSVNRFAKVYEKIMNRRMDFIHKLTHRLVNDFDEIHIEDIDPQDMAKRAVSKKLKRKIIDLNFGMFKRLLTYKAQQHGKRLIVVDKYFPSSQICSECGYQNKNLRNTHIRDWECPNCGSHHDRDINAAINLLNYYPSIAS